MGEFEKAVLLAVLHLKDDAYGMAIRKLIEQRSGRDISIGAVYTTLERLSRKGYLSARTGDPTPERGGRAKKFYTVEPEGRVALRDSREFLSRMWGDLDPAGGLEPGSPGR